MRQRTVDFLADHRRERVPALTDRLVRTIQEQNPGYRAARVVPLDDLRRSCHDNITRVLQLLAGLVAEAPDEDGEGYYDAARATGSRRAEQGLPLDDVLRSFRVGGRLIWEDLVEEARAHDALDADGLREVGTRLWQVVDETSAQVASAYHATERLLVREDEARRASLWEGLLNGRAKDQAFAHEAARILDLPVRGRYVVVALDHRDGTGNVADVLDQRLRLRGIASGWQRRADGLVGLLTLPAADLDGAVGILREWTRTPVGVSVLVTALAEVDGAYRQATLALRTLLPDQPGIARFDHCLPEALLLSAPEVAGRLVDVWLGPLLALPAAEGRPLLETLQIWVSTGGSTTRTAEQAHCHRNTVINRIRRVATVTGHELADGAPPVELALALRMHRLRTR
jgi:hypothetical protein